MKRSLNSKIIRTILCLPMSLAIGVFSAGAQTNAPTKPSSTPRVERPTNRQAAFEIERNRRKQDEAMQRLRGLEGQTQDRGIDIGKFDPNCSYFESIGFSPEGKSPAGNSQLRMKSEIEEKTSIEPARANRFAVFLAEPKNGFARLQSLNRSNGSCSATPFGRLFSYSFRLESNVSSEFSDLTLKGSDFELIGLNSLGFLSDLGTAEFESISETSVGVFAMAEYSPDDNIARVREQHSFVKNGFMIGDHVYRSRLSATENHVYSLRQIAYRGKYHLKRGGAELDFFRNDIRKDILVVFKVVKKHEDGSISLLWRKLWEKESPELKHYTPTKPPTLKGKTSSGIMENR